MIPVHQLFHVKLKKRRITGKGIFKECEKTNRYPFVCNGCSIKTYCRKKKYYYNYIKAQNNYEYLLKNSRIGIDMSIDEDVDNKEYIVNYKCDYNTDIPSELLNMTDIAKNIYPSAKKDKATFKCPKCDGQMFPTDITNLQ